MFRRAKRLFYWMLAAAAAWMLVESGFALRMEVGAIRLYQEYGSPISSKVVHCRYRPTCSQYALEVLQRDGFVMGNLETGHRLLMCSPVGWAWDKVSGKEPAQGDAPSAGDTAPNDP